MDNRLLKFAIIGCGLIGQKRLNSLRPEQLAVACDLNLERAQDLTKRAKGSGRATTLVEDAIHDSNVDAVIVATTNDSLAKIASKVVSAGKSVLLEKPGAISVAEIEALQQLASEKQIPVRVGYNHRYHPALQKAHQIVDSGELGPLMFVRGRYGHGGRVGYDKEWRADPQLSGGGELIDQGVHLIDLAGWFLGDFQHIDGHADTYFWEMPVDDNAFVNLRTSKGQTAWLHVSCTEWKNLFSFEIYGRDGKLHIEGLGGSYGVERLSYYRMLPEMGPPETTIWEYPHADQSWALEMREFIYDIRENRTPSPGLKEAHSALTVVERIYKQSH